MAAALRPESRHPRGDDVRLHPHNPRPWDLPPRSRAPLQSRPPRLRPRPQDPPGAARTAPARGPIPAGSPALASPIRRRHRERARTHARTSCVASQLPWAPPPGPRTPPRPRRAHGSPPVRAGEAPEAEVHGDGEGVAGARQHFTPPHALPCPFSVLGPFPETSVAYLMGFGGLKETVVI